jgi:hypothetical protein
LNARSCRQLGRPVGSKHDLRQIVAAGDPAVRPGGFRSRGSRLHVVEVVGDAAGGPTASIWPPGEPRLQVAL